MTDDEILAMAEEAGFYWTKYPDGEFSMDIDMPGLRVFINLVAAKERSTENETINPRIRELAEQVGIRFPQEDIENFAKLIIQECVTAIGKNNCLPNINDWDDGHVSGMKSDEINKLPNYELLEFISNALDEIKKETAK